MIQAWRNFWDNFLNNEAYFIARVRAVVMFFAVGGIAFAHDVSESLGFPGLERWLKLAAIVASAVAVLMRAGEKNEPKPEEPKP